MAAVLQRYIACQQVQSAVFSSCKPPHLFTGQEVLGTAGEVEEVRHGVGRGNDGMNHAFLLRTCTL